MSTTRNRHRVDGNQGEIVDALFRAGCRVQTLATVGAGCPDLLVSRGGQMWVIECKMPGETLNDLQRKWHKTWDAPVAVVTTAEEALAVIGGTR